MDQTVAAFIELTIYIGTPALVIAGGFFIGRHIEKKHVADMERREALVRDVVVCNFKSLPPNWNCVQCDVLAHQVVIGSDAFKSFTMQIRNFFGGEVRGLGSLMLRARREALLRVMEDAKAQGANAVWNVRYETSTIGRAMGNQGLAMAEVMAYGTALWITDKR